MGLHGETLLDYSTYDALKCGFGRVVYIIRPDIEKDFRERLFDRVARNCDAEYVFQTKSMLLSAEEIKKSENRVKPWGTAHAVLCAKDVVKEPFAVINADDFYGRGAFKTLGEYLSAIDVSCTDHSMVGYVLKNTTSPSGTVSRGVCTIDDSGYLLPIKENTKIEHVGEKIVSHLEDTDVYLSGNETVSMNLFGFSPVIFENLTEFFNDFIRDNVCEPKKECLLPVCVANVISKGKGSVKVFSTNEKWFGVTYKEDKETVMRALKEKTELKVYPEKLWDR